ncbi:MAG: HAD family hydrolase, partial [Gemmatimonadota bacterium]
RCGVTAQEFVMVGDSLKSDILPVLEAGGRAIHVPYDSRWEYELLDERVPTRYRYSRVESLRDVPAQIEALESTR